MAITTPLPSQGQTFDPTLRPPPPPQAPPPTGDRQGPGGRPRWYRRNWGIGLIALVVGIGLGAATGSNKTVHQTTTVTSPALTVTATVAGGTTTVIKKVPGPTRTVTKTVTATATPAPASSGSPGALSWSGNGIRTIGTITVPVDSTLKWTNDGGSFSIYDDENAVEVSSQAASGQSDLPAGTYHGFSVNAMGNWTINIVPK